MTSYFSNLSGIQKLFLALVFVVSSAIGAAYAGGGWPLALPLMAFILALCWITKGIWLPAGAAVARLRTVTVMGFYAVLVPAPFWFPIVNSFLSAWKKDSVLVAAFPWIKQVPLLHDHPAALTLLAAFMVVFVVFYFTRDKTTTGKPLSKVDEAFPEKDYPTRLKAVCAVMKDRIGTIDRETNWSPEYYVPLDAEVIETEASVRVGRVGDLQKAIRRDKTSRFFLLLGDPGAGKSVALRKLCLSMLDEVPTGGRLPIYLNLREWHVREKWTVEHLPTVADLQNFIEDSLRNFSDVHFEHFIKDYFARMAEDGRLFYIFDSFDEIASVLDQDEQSPLVDALSDVFHRFLSGAHASRGIIASRLFRQPTAKLAAPKRLEIRPLSDVKIARLLEDNGGMSTELIRRIFKERTDLIPVLRNPFSASLLALWLRDHRGDLPQSKALLFEHHITSSLARSADYMARNQIGSDEAIATSIEIAALAYEQESFGLEIPLSAIEHGVQGVGRGKAVAELLCYSRLMRKIPAPDVRYAFVHRRFAEYFVALAMLNGRLVIDEQEIPKDSRWRDAFVLFVEIAPDDRAVAIAEYCVGIVCPVDQAMSLEDKAGFPALLSIEAIHCLRFLVDAFGNSDRLSVEQVGRLDERIMRLVENTARPLQAKLALEAICLLAKPRIERGIVKAFLTKMPWLVESALRSTRLLGKPSHEIVLYLHMVAFGLPYTNLLKLARALRFTLQLTEGLQTVQRFLTFRIVIFMAQVACLGLVAIWFPLITAFVIVPVALLFYLSSSSAHVVLTLVGTLIVVGSGAGAKADPLFRLLSVPWLAEWTSVLLWLGVQLLQSIDFRLPKLSSLIRWFSLRCIRVIRGIFTSPLAWITLGFGLANYFLGDFDRDMAVIAFLGTSCVFLVFVFLDRVTVRGMVAGLHRDMANLFQDVRQLRDLRVSPVPTSVQIVAKELASLKTLWAKQRYLRSLLSTRSIIRIEALNGRSDSTFGSFEAVYEAVGDDRTALEIIARLEEKWLGLDR